jgi:hypothetical protein
MSAVEQRVIVIKVEHMPGGVFEKDKFVQIKGQMYRVVDVDVDKREVSVVHA